MSDDTLPGTRSGDPASRSGDPVDSTTQLPAVDHEPETLAAPSGPDDPGGPDDPSGPDEPKPGRRKKRKGFVRRHKFLIALAIVLALVAGTAGGYYWWLNHQLSAIPRLSDEDSGITTDPQKNHHESNEPLNILLLGADNGGDSESVAEDLKDHKWTPGIHRSDTIMIAHIPADRDSVQLVSIPRDSWVPIPGYGTQKINAAFSYGGPKLAVETVQDLTGIHIDHLAIIDWTGFKELTTALGGVRVYIPETFYDDSQRITWTKGWHTLEGQEALAYVRTRHGLINGDFGRIERQQNFMRATMGKLLSQTHNVFTMTRVVNTISKFLTIDASWDNDEIKDLALSMMNIHSGDVQFLTAPFGSYGTSTDGQSYVNLAPRQSERLFHDIATDNIEDYLEKYPEDELKNGHHIS